MKRKSIPKKIQLETWVRDKWVCRYCNEPIIFAPTLKLLNKISPNHGYYHPHGDESKMVLNFARLWASVDHITPFSKGGSDDKENLATACWRCNNVINDKTELQGKPKIKPINEKIGKTHWDGMASIYLKLNDKEDTWTKLLKELL